jgi:hypothetical protein
LLKRCVGQLVAADYGAVELIANFWVRSQFGAVFKSLVVGEELALEDAEAGEFAEEITGGLGNGPERICRVQPLPGGKILMGLVKLQVVHALKATLNFCGSRGVGHTWGAHQQQARGGEPFASCLHTALFDG